MYNNNYYQQNQYQQYQQPGYSQNGFAQQSYNSQMNQQPQVNTNFIPMYFVSSEEDVKKYIVMPNQIAYFKDMNSNIVYEKKADNFSNYITKKYEMNDMSLPNQKYATVDDINNLREEVKQMIGAKTNEQ